MLRDLVNLPRVRQREPDRRRMKQRERDDDRQINQRETQRKLDARDGTAARQGIDLPALRVAALFSGENSAQFAALFPRKPPQHVLIRAALQSDNLRDDRRQQRVALAGEVREQPRAEEPE